MSTQFENQSDVLEDVLIDDLEPDMYNVIFHNDDYTPMEFVILVISGIFQKNVEDAFNLTMQIHNEGKAIVAQYIKEIAEDKKELVMRLAKENGHPLLCTIEKAPKAENSNKNKFGF